jgi:hypothetical protein
MHPAMSHSHPTPVKPSLEAMKLEDYGKLQERYQALTLTRRAEAVLDDAQTALKTADKILATLGNNPMTAGVFDTIRQNVLVTGRMRACEAKNMLLDTNNDFIDLARHKLAVWRKTMERISQGEGVVSEKTGEYISSNVPLAMALASASTVTNYLSMIQLAFTELAKLEPEKATQYNISSAKVRRCATLLSDCENAASFTSLVH